MTDARDKRDKAAEAYRRSYELVRKTEETEVRYACDEVHANGSIVDTWNDNAHCDYPEDLIWSRMISGCYMSAGEHGFKAGWDAREGEVEALRAERAKVEETALKLNELNEKIMREQRALLKEAEVALELYAEIDESRWSLWRVAIFNMRIGNWARATLAKLRGTK